MDFKYEVGEICIFTNRGSSGVTKNDGRRCKVTKLKDGPEWNAMYDEGIYKEPHYNVEFLDDCGVSGFGCKESELKPTT